MTVVVTVCILYIYFVVVLQYAILRNKGYIVIVEPGDQHKGMVDAVGQVRGRPDLVEVLRYSGCSTMVIRKDLCDPGDFTGETRGCVMMDGRVIEVPVVTKTLDTPHYTGIVEGVAMDSPFTTWSLETLSEHGTRRIQTLVGNHLS